jgi:hypothetical protein
MVGLALEAAVGGLCGLLKVSLLRDRVFSFCVASKAVGFQILNLKCFSCTQFKCYFHLWGRGGPSWTFEYKKWQYENSSEWTLVSPAKKKLVPAPGPATKTKSIVKTRHASG